MLSITHFRSPDASFADRAKDALAALAARPGYVRGTLARSTDDTADWVLVTEWENVGSYRRALGNYDVKLRATPLLGEALDLPSAFEALVDVAADGDRTVRERPRMTVLPRPEWWTPTLVKYTRWTAITVWLLVFGYDLELNGIPYWRSDLLLWLSLGLLAWSVGRRNVLTVAVDFVPFAAVLVAYDYLRGISDTLGMPTWWHPQVQVDKFLFLGTEPTVWLQAHLRYPSVRWYDVLVALCYISFFFLPYVTAAALWLRSRADFYRWALRFVPLSFVAFGFFALMPTAPPWAAARCTALQVADHPNNPLCMASSTRTDGGLLGQMTDNRGGTPSWVEQIATRGLDNLHLHFASQVIDAGRVGSDAVAAVPSLHAGGIMLFAMFMWPRLNRWWRPLLVAYPLFMGFTLVYAGEHYVADVLAGWLCAVAVHRVATRIERRRKAQAPTDSLMRNDRPETVETPCPPPQPAPAAQPPATTPSSI